MHYLKRTHYLKRRHCYLLKHCHHHASDNHERYHCC